MVGQKNLDQMLKDVLVRLQHAYGSNPTIETTIKMVLNDKLAEYASAYDWPQLNRTDELGFRSGDTSTLFSFEAGEINAPMPLDTVNIKSLAMFSPSYRFLQMVSASELYARAQASINRTGHPEYAAFVGQTAQHVREPKDAAILTVKSDVATTNDLLTVRVHYRPRSYQFGIVPWEDVTGDFNTGIALSKAVGVGWPVEAVDLPADWVGNLTIEDDSAVPVVIVQVDPREVPGTSSANANWRAVQRPLLRLWPTPSADSKVSISYVIDHPPLTENEDRPLIPVAQVLVEATTASMFRRARKHEIARHHDLMAEKILSRIVSAQQQHKKVIRPDTGNVCWQSGMYNW